MQPTFSPLNGLVVATFTSMHEDRSVSPNIIPAMVDRLFSQGIAALENTLGNIGFFEWIDSTVENVSS